MLILNNMNPYSHCGFRGTYSNSEIDSLLRKMDMYSDSEKINKINVFRNQINCHNLPLKRGQMFVKTVSQYLYSNNKELKFASINAVSDALKENYINVSNVPFDNVFLNNLFEPEYSKYHFDALKLINTLRDKRYRIAGSVYAKAKNVLLDKIHTKNPDEILTLLKMLKFFIKTDFLNEKETETALAYAEKYSKSHIPDIREQVQGLKDIIKSKKQKSKVKVRVISSSENPNNRHCEGYQSLAAIFKYGMYSDKDISAKVREIITKNSNPEMVT